MYLSPFFSVCVTLMKSDWSGEQVNVQNRFQKFSLHAGHADMKAFALSRFCESASSCKCLAAVLEPVLGHYTCSLSQQMGPEFHFGPHISTSCFLTSSSGSFASPLSGQGSSGPKRLDFPQVPRKAHRPVSCFGVYASADTRVVANSPEMTVEGQNRPIAALEGAPPSVANFLSQRNGVTWR